MANIYKPEQGYWTRTMSAIGAGVLAVTFTFWVWQQLDAFIDPKLTYKSYIQMGVALALMTVLGTLIYRWVYVKPKSCDFMIATEGEMKKVNWPSQREIKGATWIVIAFVILLVGILFIADAGFYKLFEAIGVLATPQAK